MSDCNHMPPKKYECVQCLLDKVAAQQESIWELEETVSGLESQLNSERAVRHMAVSRLGGAVEGRPTQWGNFLQRIDELVAIERKANDAVS